jgi:hypothetical protein
MRIVSQSSFVGYFVGGGCYDTHRTGISSRDLPNTCHEEANLPRDVDGPWLLCFDAPVPLGMAPGRRECYGAP